MNEPEKLIVSFTSWTPRFGNIPIVLDSVFNQTVKPDLVVLNLANDEVLPEFLETYIGHYGVEVKLQETL